jgi:hypothetical protein
VYRISDAGSTDKVGGIYFCTVLNALDLARSAVNRGTSGGGLEIPWTFTTVDGYIIMADQT